MGLKFRLLKASEIDCRIATVSQKGVSLLLYKDARVDQNILDETVGPMNWQRSHSRDNANCTVSLWDEEKNNGYPKRIPELRVTLKRKRVLHLTVSNVPASTGASVGNCTPHRLYGFRPETVMYKKAEDVIQEESRDIHVVNASR